MSERMLHTKICLVSNVGNVRTYVTHGNTMSRVECPNICYTRIGEYFLSELMLHTKMCNARTYVTLKYEMFSVRTYVTYENIICPNLC